MSPGPLLVIGSEFDAFIDDAHAAMVEQAVREKHAVRTVRAVPDPGKYHAADASPPPSRGDCWISSGRTRQTGGK